MSNRTDHLPEVDRIKLETRESIFCAKAKVKQDAIEKGGKFYVLKDFKPLTTVFVPEGENVEIYLLKYVEKMSLKSYSLRRMKV